MVSLVCFFAFFSTIGFSRGLLLSRLSSWTYSSLILSCLLIITVVVPLSALFIFMSLFLKSLIIALRSFLGRFYFSSIK